MATNQTAIQDIGTGHGENFAKSTQSSCDTSHHLLGVQCRFTDHRTRNMGANHKATQGIGAHPIPIQVLPQPHLRRTDIQTQIKTPIWPRASTIPTLNSDFLSSFLSCSVSSSWLVNLSWLVLYSMVHPRCFWLGAKHVEW